MAVEHMGCQLVIVKIEDHQRMIKEQVNRFD
jgi:hypothetical protein